MRAQTGLDVQKDPMAMQRIKEASEKAKIELSSSLQVRSCAPLANALASTVGSR